MSCSVFWKKIRKTGSDLLFPNIAVCAICGRDLREGALCPACAEKMRGQKLLQVERLFGILLYSCYRYGGCVRTLLLRFKLRGEPWLAGMIAEQMAEFLLSREERFFAVSFVPLSKKRQIQRGYNQAELLAREIASRLSIEALPLLTRVRKTKVQSRLSHEKRERNLSGAFGLTEYAQGLAGRRILLVDDIATTGTTLKECAKPLQQAGASVTAIVFARA